MTTIRRIVTSQVEGGNANQNDQGEIRPFGEVAIYMDTNSNPDKLTLMMFNGERTHIKSKVLQPGVLFGSNEDSGDGAGLDTIKLVPDSTLYEQNSDQYIVIDPTFPNHIHIRAGGTIDNSSAELFLGGEHNHVNVSDVNKNITITTTSISNDTSSWTFNPKLTGEGTIPANIRFPDGTHQRTAWAGGRVVSAPNNSTGSIGDLEGDIAFTLSHFYYCISDYTDGLSNIWKRIAWSEETW